jgi:hypothetical protein
MELLRRWEVSQRRLLFELMEMVGVVSMIGGGAVEDRIAVMPMRDVSSKIRILRDGFWMAKNGSSTEEAVGGAFRRARTLEIIAARSILDLGFVAADYEVFEERLWTDVGIKIRGDGLCEFRAMTEEVLSLLDGVPAVVFHYTSSAVWDAVKESGLLPGKSVAKIKGEGTSLGESMNSTIYFDGFVHLTSESSGELVESYEEAAVAALGGRPLRLDVEVDIVDLIPDPSPEIISTGRRSTHFVMEWVRPQQIINFR